MITLDQDQFSKGFYARLSKVAVTVPGTNPAPVTQDKPVTGSPGVPPATPGAAAGTPPGGSIPAPAQTTQKPIPDRTIPPSTSPPDNPNLTHPTQHFNNASDAAWNGARDGASNNLSIPSGSDWLHHPFDSAWNATVGNAENATKGAFNGAINNVSDYGKVRAETGAANDLDRMGLATTRDQYGAPTGVNVQKTTDNALAGAQTYFSNSVAKPFMDEFGKLQNGDWGSLGTFAQEHPWLTGGAAALGAGGLYGGYKMLSGMFGGDEQQGGGQMGPPHSYTNNMSAYGVPQPQALMKASMVKRALGFPSPFAVPTMAAGFLAGEEPKKPQQVTMMAPPQPQQYNIHPGDEHVRQLLQDPRMRAYIQHVVAGT